MNQFRFTLEPSKAVSIADELRLAGGVEYAYTLLRGTLLQIAKDQQSSSESSLLTKVYPTTKDVIEAGLKPHDTKEYAEQIMALFTNNGVHLSYLSIVERLTKLNWFTAGDVVLVRHGDDGTRTVYRRRVSDALTRLVNEKSLARDGQFYCKHNVVAKKIDSIHSFTEGYVEKELRENAIRTIAEIPGKR